MLRVGTGALVWLIRSSLVEGLALGLVGDITIASANALGWSAFALALAMLAALWVTRLQHERDFVGIHAGNLIVNLALVIGLFVLANGITPATYVLSLLGFCLVIAMIGRLAWLAWRLSACPKPVVIAPDVTLSRASVSLWAAL